MKDARFSRLADMLVCHIISGRYMKALKIAQYLRKYHGDTIASINHRTGQSYPKTTTSCVLPT